MIDLHIHTALCRHATGMPAEYVAVAEATGLAVMAFTDHLPLPAAADPEYDYTMAPQEMEEYLQAVAEAAEGAKSVEVLLGIEADWLPSDPQATAAALAAHPFDVVLGSVHFLDGWAFDDPRLEERYDEWDVTQLWERYFSEVIDAAQSGLFDVMAHPDLVKKFCHRPTAEPVGLYQDVAAALADAGVAIEVSTGGLRKRCRELYPGTAFLAACARAGVPATTGSDAHTPQEVGFAMGLAERALRDAGYESMLVFRERTPQEVPLS